MNTYRFVGTKMSIGDIELVKVGQSVQLETVDPRWPLVTEKQFEAAAFDAAQLEKFGHHQARHMAPPDFMEKLKSLWALIGKPDAAETTKKGSK